MESSMKLMVVAMFGLASAGAFADPTPRSPEGAERTVIGEYIRAHGPSITDCYNRRLDFKPKLGGRLILRFDIGSDGKVLGPTTDGIPDQPLSDCVVAETRTWLFPKPPPGEILRIAYPINFKPPA